jgi:aminocarboxymuconate-semialdehyde decarboxylase
MNTFKIDIHTHILPPEIPSFKSRFGYGGFMELRPCAGHGEVDMYDDSGRFFRRVKENCLHAEPRIRDCDKSGVHVQALSTLPTMFAYWAKPQDGLVVSQFLNDHIAGVVQKSPKRFVGLGTVPLQAPDLAIREAERAVRELGFVGFQIGSHVGQWNLSDPALFPFYKACEDLGAALFVHPWDMMGQERMPKYWLPWLVGMPAETTLAICSMIFGGVFEKFPKLRVAFAHGGGSFPFTLGRIQHGFESRPDLCAVDNPISPKSYLGRFYVDSLVHDERALHYLIELIGAKNICLGSDYPFPLGEETPGELIERVIPDLETREWLLSRSALNFLNLNRERFV